VAFLGFPDLDLLVVATWMAGIVTGGGIFGLRKARKDSFEARKRESRLRQAETDLVKELRSSYVEPDNVVTGPVGGKSLPSTEDVEDGDAIKRDPTAVRSLTLPALWDVTHARLSSYHAIALKQAKQSFRTAQGAMVLGFFLLAGFMLVAWKASTTSGSVVAGGLGAVAATLAGYVSKTFIKSQETASVALRSYFDQPLELSRYLAAERLMVDAGLDAEKRAELLGLIVKAMLIRSGTVAATEAAGGDSAAGEK
jgi:hypothetical protein